MSTTPNIAATPQDPPPAVAHAAKQPQHGAFSRFLNGKPLDFAEWLSNVMIVPVSLHRFGSATGLMLGMGLGATIGNAVTGHKLFNVAKWLNGSEGSSKLALENFHYMLRPLVKPIYETLPYQSTPHMATTYNRMLRLAHCALPLTLGMFGNYLGSKWFFNDREKKFRHPNYIDEYDEKIAFDQSKPYGTLSAVTSGFNISTGVNFLPFSYGEFLGLRFLLGSNYRIAFPWLGYGKFMSNNTSYIPLGSAPLRDHMLKYALHNPDPEPAQLKPMAAQIIYDWFGDQPDVVTKNGKGYLVARPEYVDGFVEKLLAIRNKYYQEGGIPPALKPECEKEMKAHFCGAGLEKTLWDLGLNVTKADIANNGFVGRLANRLGAGKTVRRETEEFQQKAEARHQEMLAKASGQPSTRIQTDAVTPGMRLESNNAKIVS